MAKSIIISEPILAFLRDHLYCKYGLRCHPRDKVHLIPMIVYELVVALEHINYLEHKRFNAGEDVISTVNDRMKEILTYCERRRG